MNPLLTSVATEVAGEFGSRLSAILATTRGRAEDARSRAIAIYVYRYSEAIPYAPCYTELGKVFERDRTTIRHALARVEGWKKTEKGFKSRLESVQQRVAARGYPGGVQ